VPLEVKVTSKKTTSSDRTVVAFENPMYSNPKEEFIPPVAMSGSEGLYDDVPIFSKTSSLTKHNPLYNSQEDLAARSFPRQSEGGYLDVGNGADAADEPTYDNPNPVATKSIYNDVAPVPVKVAPAPVKVAPAPVKPAQVITNSEPGFAGIAPKIPDKIATLPKAARLSNVPDVKDVPIVSDSEALYAEPNREGGFGFESYEAPDEDMQYEAPE